MVAARREGTGEETGGEIWDPLDISGSVGDEALMWFRAAELKHGRVSMLACVGYLLGAAGITFPGEIAKGVTFASVGEGGVFGAWSNVPEAGKLQILVIIAMLETATESKKPHYMRGGVPGKIDSLPFDGVQGIWACVPPPRPNRRALRHRRRRPLLLPPRRHVLRRRPDDALMMLRPRAPTVRCTARALRAAGPRSSSGTRSASWARSRPSRRPASARPSSRTAASP